MKATLLVTIYGLCATALLAFYSVYEWLSPTTPIMIGAVAVLIPSFLIVFGLEEEARPPNPNMMLWVQTMLLAAIFGLAIPAMWTTGDTRSKVLTRLPSLRAAEFAIADAHPAVQQSACNLLFDEKLGALGGQIADILSRNPATASTCLKTVAPSDKLNEVTRQLAVSWHQSLLDGAEAQCVNAAAIDTLPIAAANRVGFLLDCALRGNETTRVCCVAQLAAAYPDAKLEVEIKKGAPVIRQLGSSAFLLAAAFDEKNYVASIAPTAKQLQLQTDGLREASLDLACSAVVEEAGRSDDMRYLEWLFDQHTGCLENREGTTDVVAACRLILDLEPAQRKDLDRALCDANRTARAQKLAAAAAFRTGAAFGDNADGIDRGRATLQGERLSAENFEELMKSGEVSDLSDDERMALIDSFRPGQENPTGLTPQEIETQGGNVQTKEGRDELMAATDAKLSGDFVDSEKVLGVSIDELRESLDENGEISPEMKKRLDARHPKGEKNEEE